MNRGRIGQVQRVKLIRSVLHRSSIAEVNIQRAFILRPDDSGHDADVAVADVGDVLRLHDLIALTEDAFAVGEFRLGRGRRIQLIP